MNKYTIVCDYYATGEGRTMIVLYTTADNMDQVKNRFVQVFNEYFWRGMECYDGFIFQNDTDSQHMTIEAIDMLVTSGVRKLLEKDIMSEFYAQLHFNLA